MSLDLFRLDGQSAVVTGSGRGLGAAIAKALAAAGANVVLCSRHQNECQGVLEEIRQDIGGKGLALGVDVTSRSDVESLCSESLRCFGTIDILVNNAGVNLFKSALELSSEEVDRIMNINYKGAFHCCQVFGRHFLERKKGRVINICSVLSSGALPGFAAYAPTKAALLQLTRVLALEWAPYNVLVNAVCPGPFMTPMNEQMRQDEEAFERSRRRVPLQRWGRPEELGGAVIYLASEASSYVTGSTLCVDGGRAGSLL